MGDKIWGCGRPFETLDALKAHLGLNESCRLGHLPYLDKQQLDCVMSEVIHLPYPCLKVDGGCGRRSGSAIDWKAHLNLPFESHCMRSRIILEAVKNAELEQKQGIETARRTCQQRINENPSLEIV
ncbi:hypothetical protein OCU04_012415 [Sclerotinia nivalis]|uniref:Uncharacterized protein n=1 Tax=Sclerotinia nivalis TaxID=352851 RepID=A0A9X0DEV1_9HELO|nr:hypothetical protein OCU04_012415 [Sclerotinia nivalis]